MNVLEEISESLLSGDSEGVSGFTKKAVEEGFRPGDILDSAVAAMKVVGARFQARDIFLPDVLMAAKAMNAGLEILKPLLAGEELPNRGKVVLGTVRGDLHDIGKNLVGIMLRGAGFEVIDLGKDVAPADFVDTASREGARVIGMSALLTTTTPVMATVVRLLTERGLSPAIKTIVGGPTVSPEFAREIGADAYGFDAASAVEQVNELFRELE